MWSEEIAWKTKA